MRRSICLPNPNPTLPRFFPAPTVDLMQKSAVMAQLEAHRLIAMARIDGAEELIRLAHALAAGGITALEVPLTCPAGPEWVAEAVSALPGFLFGIGTVTDTDTARRCIRAGARFLSTPGLRPDVILLCRRYQLPVICGAHSRPELEAAVAAGTDAIKLYPAKDRFGPTHVRETRAAYPSVRLYPVGGITAENVADFLAAGAAAAFVASGLIRSAAGLGDFEPTELSARAAALVTAAASAVAPVATPA